ncbi:MAG: UTP--glucose-1-phosphate uridylyltransferase [Planctomycetota bacterium]|nr:UTP--glucose-1-phosphate uridylyltransferase [Planctomycetota bacterium]
MTAFDPAASRAHLVEAGQAHLVEHAATLSETEAERFLAHAAAQPWAALAKAAQSESSSPATSLRPPQGLTWKRQQAQGGVRGRLAEMGQAFLAGGRVATILLAGGQGTRLGHPGPKGTYVFGPEPDRTLFKILGERIAAAGRRAGRAVPYYVLVSPATEAATREAFEEAPSWGLDPAQIHFVVQGQLPAVDDAGRGLLAAPGELAMAPDGHGGLWPALVNAGVLDELAAAGIDALTTFQVDNPLGRPLDPVMLGWMVERKAQIVSKGVAKATPDERVGVLARDISGRHRIVEYTELPDDVPESVNLGSIAVHAFGVRFLKDLFDGGYEMPLHRAHKKVAHLDAAGALVKPTEPNAWKLERFLFDIFPEADRFEVHEVKRTWEFAPVKNAEGTDSPATSRLLVDAEVRRWHTERKLPLPDPVSLHPLEVDGAEAYL